LNRVLEHRAGCSGITANQYDAAANIRSKSLSKSAGKSGSQELADNATDARDADFQQVLSRH
jgi:hypothetical protein